MRLEIRHDARDKWPGAVLLFAQRRERFERQIMRAKHHVGLELLHETREALLGAAGKFALDALQPPQQFRIVRFGEHHSPKLRRAFHKLDVAVGINFPVQRRKQFQQVNFFDDIIRTGFAPCFLQRGRGGQMSPARRHRGDQNSHARKN